MNRAYANRQHGFSLIELMIALAAGLIVSVAAVAFLMSSFRSNADYVKSTKLTQELRSTLDLITRDLRRAGYDETAMGLVSTGTATSRFTRMNMCNASNVCTTGATPPITCVIYAYDRAGGTPGTLDQASGEIHGIRRKQVTNAAGVSVGVVEYAVSTSTAKPACSGAGPDYSVFPVVCNTATTWCPLSDPAQLDITALTFADTGANTGGVILRDINVALQGRIAGSTEFTRGVRSNIRIRSECYDPTIANCSASP